MKKQTLLAGALIFALPLLSTFGLDFVKNGKALTGVTRVSDEKGAILAVKELTEYTKKVTKADISKLKNGKIIIGTVKSKGIPKSIVDKLKKNLSDEAFFLGEINGKYYIVGQNGVAAYYGTLEFMERNLGIHWYYPGEKGERYKPKTTVIIPKKEEIHAPTFAYRILSTVGSSGLCPQGRSWAGRNRLQSPSQGHTATLKNIDIHSAHMLIDRATVGSHETFTIPIPVKKYGKTHPEYFALVEGKRRVSGRMPHYCLSNKDVQQKVYEFVIDSLKRYKGFTFNFGCVDTQANICECDECRKMDGGSSLDISRRFHVFAQEVSKRVWKKYPNAKLSQWAYWNYREYPKGLKLDPRTIIYYCATRRCYSHALDDPSCARNVQGLKWLKEWLNVCKKVYIYEYAFPVDHAYQPYSEVLLKDLKLYKKLGVAGRKEEMIYPDAARYRNFKQKGIWYTKNIMASRWQFWYLKGRWCWNPDADFEKSISAIEKDFYGKLYPAMKKYHDLRRKLWRETPGCVGFPRGDQRTPMVLQKPGAREELQKYLAEAEKLAGKDPALKRIVEYEKGALYNYWIIPNEKYRKSLSRTASAPMVKVGPKIDGKGNDPVWGRACYITDFRDTFGKKEPMPSAIATSVGILSDKENLYFLRQAKEPFMKDLRFQATAKNKKDIWKDDTFEVMVAPVNNNFKYYQFAVNANGAIQEVEQPGDNMAVSLGATAKATRNKDGFVIELKVPVKRLEGKFNEGAIWKFHVTRNYRVGKSSKLKHFSLDGTAYHATTDYRSLTIGSPVIKNGSFEEGIDKKTSRAKFWGYRGKQKDGIKLIKEKGNTLIHVSSERCISQILYGRFFCPKKSVKVALTFKVKGKGALRVVDARFTTAVNKQQKRYNRYLKDKTKVIAQIPLTEKERIHTLEYTIDPGEFSQIRFTAVGKGSYFIMDDVSAGSAE